MRKIHCFDIWNIRSLSGDYKLPARRNGIIKRVIYIIAKFNQARHNNIIVAILRKSKSLFRHMCCILKKFIRRILAHSQIYLWINQQQLHWRIHTHSRKLVKHIFAFSVKAAQNHTLSVVALLKPKIKVGIKVYRDEKFFDYFKYFLIRNTSFFILKIKRVHILVESSESYMICKIHSY